jgi:hypothetical protein
VSIEGSNRETQLVDKKAWSDRKRSPIVARRIQLSLFQLTFHTALQSIRDSGRAALGRPVDHRVSAHVSIYDIQRVALRGSNRR